MTDDNDNAEPGFQLIGSQATPIENSVCNTASMSTASSRSSETTGPRSLAQRPSSSIGAPRSKTASSIVPSTLQELLAGEDSELTDRGILASLPPSVAQALVARTREHSDGIYGFDWELVGYDLSGQPPHDDVTTAIAMVARCLRPSTERQIQLELGRLRVSTKSRPEDPDDLVLCLQVYLEECAQHPIDIVRTALRALPRRERFWPALIELREELQKTSRRRRALHDALATAAQSNHGTEATWRRYLRARTGADSFDRWFKDVEVRSVTDGTVTLEARSRFIAGYIKTNFMIDLCEAWHRSDATIDRVAVVAK
jgi:hypothetical protein